MADQHAQAVEAAGIAIANLDYAAAMQVCRDLVSTPPATDEAALSKFIDKVWNTAVDKSFHAQSGIYQQKVYDALKAELRSMLATAGGAGDDVSKIIAEANADSNDLHGMVDRFLKAAEPAKVDRVIATAWIASAVLIGYRSKHKLTRPA